MIKNKKFIVYLMVVLSLFLLTGCMNSSGGGSKKLNEISEVKPYKVDGEVVISEEVEALYEDFTIALIQRDGSQVSTVELDNNGKFKFSSGKKLTVRPVSKKEGLTFEPEEVVVSSTETIQFKAVVQDDTIDNHDGEDTNQKTDSIAPEIKDIADQTISEGENFNLQVEATDNISETLIYSADGLPQGATIDNNTGEINWDNATAGLYPIAVSAKDEANNVSESSFNLEVMGNELNLSISDVQNKTISAGYKHSLALKSDGSLLSWGINDGIGNDYGQVTDTPLDNDFIQVSSHNHHSLALKNDGTVVGWGFDTSGQATEMPDINTFVQVDAGDQFSIGVTSIGTLEVWGGLFSIYLPEGNDFVQAAAGNGFVLAIREDGTIDGGGSDNYNQLSYIPSGNNFVQVDAGQKHGVALRENGTIEVWGDDSNNQVSHAPEGSDFVQVVAATTSTMALRSNGKIEVWGNNHSNLVDNAPQEKEFVSIAAGSFHAVALRKDGTLVAWGYDDYGQVSDAPSDNDFKLN